VQCPSAYLRDARIRFCRIRTIRHFLNEMKGSRRKMAQDDSEPIANRAPAIDRDELSRFCQRHGIRRLALFGSALRCDFGPDSDVDVLVEFEPERIPGFAFFAIQEELSDLLGRRVDLRTPKDLSRYFRDEVLRTAETLYAA